MTHRLLRSDFYYDLPEELIAQDPLEKRDDSRLLVLDRDSGKITHDIFHNIVSYLEPGDLLVLNDTKVIPARLLGTKEETGASVEILLLKNKGSDIWECLVRPGKKLRKGARVSFGDGILKAEITDVTGDGNRLVRFFYDGIWEEVLDSLGEMPLPPYITHKLKDRGRYQTVYAKNEGSAAAPTAGLHFTDELLSEIKAKGVGIVYVTLHVGLGTFRPVKEDNILDHHMHTEWYEISGETADSINKVRRSGTGRVICVGTTSCRTIEAASVEVPDETLSGDSGRSEDKAVSGDRGRSEDRAGSGDSGRSEDKAGSGERIRYEVKAGSAETDIFIYPGYDFKVTDALITNFHLPESTLIMLVSALGGYDNIMRCYKEAVKERYRFFSFGDAMMIL
ncbi:MAG: tRNA preQ1(34) S-adenosylmethionine ribosyltransferase-isomerase QueA [Lachnospiraceae bacterium]|nr:tRNA preQ1(34) S-adenosylmethionine ribosyltransferase-isomerase QueA [Lachnospiraceae bacterium]